MLLSIIRFVRGYVDFKACGRFPERFMNITSRYGINIWNATPIKNGISASMYASDYRKIRKVARKSRVKANVLSRHGIPFIARKYKSRTGLLVGAVVSVAVLLVLSNFIWSVKITGTRELSSTYLKQVLEQNGISVGAYKNDIDVESIERNISLNVEKIGWMSINLTGNIANVEIKEKADKPKLETSDTPCNIKAGRDGVITEIRASAGTTKVLKGSGAVKGDLLVSGITETKLGDIHYVRANAEVYADVSESKSFEIYKSTEYCTIGKNKTDRNRLKFLWIEFPCSLSFDTYNDFINSTREYNLFFNDEVLPLGVKTQTTYELCREKTNLSMTQAEKTAENEALLYEIFDKQESSQKSRNISIKENKTSYLVSIDYIFNENIAETVEFDVT